MAIYKKKVGYKTANIRASILWTIVGAVAGIYCFQPLFKAGHKDEKGSMLGVYLDTPAEEDLVQLEEIKKYIATLRAKHTTERAN